ncbi:hypothetical protein BN903_35 [Halorubrum sp. AJ67]|nr:hypothetical protein BN903_35 [Halorubrum sp. AJ67]
MAKWCRCRLSISERRFGEGLQSPSREAGARSLRSSSLASLVPAVLTLPAPASRLPL